MKPYATSKLIFCLIVAIALQAAVTASHSSRLHFKSSPRVRPLLSPPPRFHRANHSTEQTVHTMLGFRGGSVPGADILIAKGGDWVGSLAGPASMISGAVLSNLYQNAQADAELSVKPGDSSRIRVIKKLAKFLLTSAFAMVLSCIFFSLITRSMLLALPPTALSKIRVDDASTPMSVLRENFEFEYLTCQILIGQGLLNWLASIALTFTIPRPNQPLAVRKMNNFIATVIFFMILVMISFFNNHLMHYDNYLGMMGSWLSIMFRKFIWHWPLMPMAYVIGPVFVLAVYRGIDVLFFNRDHEDELASKHE